MLGFSGYLIVGLIVGLAYDKLILNVPAFVVMYGLMQSFGNLGPGYVRIPPTRGRKLMDVGSQ
jgi:hypothetical protein